MCAKCTMHPEELVLPEVRPLGNFRPVFCCLCGDPLKGAQNNFFEGPVCSECWFTLDKLTRREFNEWFLARRDAK